jgi:hypothetical protein
MEYSRLVLAFESCGYPRNSPIENDVTGVKHRVEYDAVLSDWKYGT